ncbi:MAG: YkgJ family cysteine cluster protein [Deltaproteobacteria bacterium]|nr:YkgJ family cysteine cluster protein [Deltaproteobacteria bacterium]
MNEKEGMASIDPVQLTQDSRFKFRCHKDVACFTKCCREIKIPLTPYDIIRLKKRVGLSSEEFLTIYTDLHLLEKTDLPMVTLKLMEDQGNACPFVREDGCIIYQDRPTTCRYYPLGVASLSHKDDVDNKGFYFFVHEPHCLGFEEDKTWSVKEWRQDQGVDIHDEINKNWTDLVVRKRSFPPNIKLTDQAKKMFFMISYNIDKFRQFVFESSFLERFDVDEKKEDDVALLNFGIDWLKEILFKQTAPEDQAAAFTGRKE